MRKYSRGEITKLILQTLLATGVIVTVLALPGIGIVYKLFKPKTSQERYRVNRAWYTLRKKKCVSVKIKNDKEIISITPRGKRHAQKYIFQDIAISSQKRWGGKWFAVVFDIPEQKKVARQALNRKLKQIGMFPLQKSTFVSPYPCRREIDFLGNYFNIRKYITYLEIHKIDNEELLKKPLH